MRWIRARSKRTKVALCSFVVFAFAGAAFAAWTITSTGPAGKGAIGSLTAPTVAYEAGNPTGVDCFPGASCSLKISVTNPNSVPLTLTGVVFDLGGKAIDKPFGTSNSGAGACPLANVTWQTSLSGLSIPIPTGTTSITIPGAYTLSAAAPTACQGSVVYLTNPATWTFST